MLQVPNVGEELNKVNDVLDIDPSLQELARKGNQSFEDIPQTVENKTVDVEKNIDNQTVKFQAIVQKHVTNVNESAYRVLNDDLSVDDIRDFVRDGTEKAVEFDKYRSVSKDECLHFVSSLCVLSWLINFHMTHLFA